VIWCKPTRFGKTAGGNTLTRIGPDERLTPGKIGKKITNRASTQKAPAGGSPELCERGTAAPSQGRSYLLIDLIGRTQI
jgi:hypothetical protein